MFYMLINDLIKSFDNFDKNIDNYDELIIQYNLQKELYKELKKSIPNSHENITLLKKLKDVIILNEKIISNNFPNVVIIYDKNNDNVELFKDIHLLRLRNRKYNIYAIDSQDDRLNNKYSLEKGKVNVIKVDKDDIKYMNNVIATYDNMLECL